MSEKLTPFDYINMINLKTAIPETLEGYEQFITNKNYAQFLETVLYANEINTDCDPQLNFDFYYYALPKKKRFSKWAKRTKIVNSKKDVLNNIIEHYNCSMEKAQEIYNILEYDNLLKTFNAQVDKGGKI